MTKPSHPPKLMLLGSGELGKEFAICAQRLGCTVVAVDNYAEAPAMQVADEAVVLDMLDGKALKKAVSWGSTDLITWCPRLKPFEPKPCWSLKQAGSMSFPVPTPPIKP